MKDDTQWGPVMLEALCPERLPGWYVFLVRDMMPVWAASIALVAASFGFRGVLRRIRFDADQRQEAAREQLLERAAVATTKGQALAIELRQRAKDLLWFADQVFETSKPDEYFEYMRDDVFIDARLRSLTNVESSVDRAWRDLFSVHFDQRPRLADALAATETAAENIRSLVADVQWRLEKMEPADDQPEMVQDDLRPLALSMRGFEYGREIASLVRDSVGSVTRHLDEILAEKTE